MQNTKPSIVVCDDYEQAALTFADWTQVRTHATVTVYTQPFEHEAATVAALKDAQIVCLMRERTPFPERLIAQLPNLKLVVFSGQRNPSLDIAACKSRGIAIANTDWGPNKSSTAEQTWALILGCSRRLTHAERDLRAGLWRGDYALPTTLHGQRLGIIGLGSIGSKVAAAGRAFGMDVVAWSQNLTAERAAEHGAILISKTELLATSHVISLHLVLSERSRHTIGEAEFSSMKDNAVLINTSRAGLIDELALIAALQSKPRMMAGLDVFNQEPLPASSALLQLPNAVLAPHLGYVTEPVFERFFTGFETACRAYLTNDLPSLGEHLL